MADTARITEVDISRPSRALAVLRLSDFVLVVGCGLGAVGLLPDLAIAAVNAQLADVAGITLTAAAFAFAAYTGWRHVGVIDPRVWRSYLLVFPLLAAVVGFMGLALAFTSISEGQSLAPTPQSFLMVVGLVWYVGIAIPGFVCVWALRKTRLEPLGVSLTDVLTSLRARGGSSGLSVTKAPRAGARRGFAYGIGGAAVLVGTTLAPVPANEQLAMNMLRATEQLNLLGFFLIVRARQYFQVSAESLLAVDKRPPVLFLRSFADDERSQYGNSRRALLDFSLETRLANHFHRFGPFIAIGSPKDTVPQPGAARVLLSDDEWQARVLGWMRESSLIIMYSGTTQWVNWELQQVVESGRATSLILMFPEIKAWRSSRRREAVTTRAEQIRSVFVNTPWHEELMAFHDFAGLRAMLFRADGSMLMVKSRSRRRDAYHLAALVAHHQILEPVSVPEEIAERVGAAAQPRRLARTLAATCAGCAAVVALYLFAQNDASRLTFKQGELYFTAPVSAAEARSVGELLVQRQVFTDDSASTVQLGLEDGVYRLRFVVDPAFADNPRVGFQLGLMGQEIGRAALGGKPVEVALANDTLEPIRVVPVTAKLAFGKSELYYTDPISEAEASGVGGQLVSWFRDQEVSVHLGREQGVYALRFVIDPSHASDAGLLDDFSELTESVAGEALGGQDVVVHLCDGDFRSLAQRRVGLAQQAGHR